MKREIPGSDPWKAGCFGARRHLGGDEIPIASMQPGY
jgi:hypothetical protein